MYMRGSKSMITINVNITSLSTCQLLLYLVSPFPAARLLGLSCMKVSRDSGKSSDCASEEGSSAESGKTSGGYSGHGSSEEKSAEGQDRAKKVEVNVQTVTWVNSQMSYSIPIFNSQFTASPALLCRAGCGDIGKYSALAKGL